MLKAVARPCPFGRGGALATRLPLRRVSVADSRAATRRAPRPGPGTDSGAVGLIIDIDMTRTEETTQLGNFFYRGVARLADRVTPAPGPVTNAAHRSISPRRWSNRSLRA